MLVGLAAAYAALLLAKAGLAIRAARRAPHAGPADLSRVAIVQPVLSGDPRLSDALEANVTALPSALFVWMVDTDDPVGHETCVSLQRRHPQARIEVLVLPPAGEGENPKLFKLERARSVIGDHVCVVVDDDARLPASSVSAVLAGLERGDVSTALPAYLDDGRWPSRLLAQFVNNNAAMTYLPLLNVADPLTINGMAYAITVGTLDRIGGFAPMLRAITDDLAVALRVRETGGRICQTSAPVWVQTTVKNGRQYVRQMHRWYLFALLLVRRQPLGWQALIALLTAVPPLLLWAVLVTAVGRPSMGSAAGVIALLALRAMVLTTLQRRIYGRPLHAVVVSIISELLQPWHLIHALLDRHIVWRTRRYRVRHDQSFEVWR